jgi:hypothetical protein
MEAYNPRKLSFRLLPRIAQPRVTNPAQYFYFSAHSAHSAKSTFFKQYLGNVCLYKCGHLPGHWGISLYHQVPFNEDQHTRPNRSIMRAYILLGSIASLLLSEASSVAASNLPKIPATVNGKATTSHWKSRNHPKVELAG